MYFLKWRRNWAKYLVFLVFGIILWTEWILYIIQYLKWPSLECGDVKEYSSVLLVADPQILGENTESWIARWDNDRFLQHTFALAVKHVQPTFIVFLGDLMDEGSFATPEQYDRYFRRFQKIFTLHKFPTNMTIFIPGDNDIGGEDEEITPFKVNRYAKHFFQAELLEHENIQFAKVNKMLTTYPKVTVPDKKISVRVVLSHMPLMGVPNYFAAKALKAIQPHIIFSAHDHKSFHFVGDPKTGERIYIEELNVNYYGGLGPSWRFQVTSQQINEVVIPTCSYRMGVMDIGYGMAIIDKKGEAVCYSILWLPHRLVHLKMYLYLVVIVCLLMFIWLLKKLFCRRCAGPLLLV